jgi:putative FmdB family regulatory protein
MPAYDFICNDCSKPFEIFLTYSEYGSKPVTCVHCGSKHTRRKMNRIRIKKSDESRVESLTSNLSTPEALSGLENDPQQMGRVFRKMGEELGEDLPPQFDEVVDRLESGQSPDEISKTVEDWTGGDDDQSGHDHSHDDT